jgi:hypothetical protein
VLIGVLRLCSKIRNALTSWLDPADPYGGVQISPYLPKFYSSSLEVGLGRFHVCPLSVVLWFLRLYNCGEVN